MKYFVSKGAVTNTPPGSPRDGDKYIDTSTNQIFIFDETDNNWVAIGSTSGDCVTIEKRKKVKEHPNIAYERAMRGI